MNNSLEKPNKNGKLDIYQYHYFNTKNCKSTILIPKGNSYCRRKGSTRDLG